MTTNTSSNPSVRGIWIPLVTPFVDDRLDENSVRSLIAHYSETDITGFILAATTGESLSLDDDETRRLVDVVQESNARHFPVLLGRTGASTRKLARSIDDTRDWPIDGYLIAAPYFTRPSQEGLYQHFSGAAEETARPIIVYNIPYRTAVNITNETMIRLAAHQNIVGVKDCCADVNQTAELLRIRPRGFSVLVGDDANFFRHVSLGADGGILASAHLAPNGYSEVLRFIRRNQRDEAQAVWDSFAHMIPLLFAEPNPGPLKFCLHQRGLIASPDVRLPIMPISEGLQERLAPWLPSSCRGGQATERLGAACAM